MSKSKSVSKKPASKSTIKKVTTNANKSITERVTITPKTTKKVRTVGLRSSMPMFSRLRLGSRGLTTVGLKKLNLITGLAQLAQGVVILAIRDHTKGFAPINTQHSVYNSLQQTYETASRHLFDINLAWIVAAFLFASAFFHLSQATWYRRRYEADLANENNGMRWADFAITGALMMTCILLLTGILNIQVLFLVFATSIIASVLGNAMERMNKSRGEGVNWFNYRISAAASIVTVVVIVHYVLSSSVYGSATPPTFVSYIYGSMLIVGLFIASTTRMLYQAKGKWANYLYGERTFIILSLLTTAALAWQIYAGTLKA